MSASILVVRDDPSVADEIRGTLTSCGYDATLSDGARALEEASKVHFDLALIDLGAAASLDGVAIGSKLRATFGMPVVYLTSSLDEASFQRAKETSPYGYLVKPVREHDLRNAVEVALRKHESNSRLVAEKKWYATTLHAIGDAVIATDSKQKVTFMNAVAERVTEWTGTDAIGRSIDDVIPLVGATMTGQSMSGSLGRAFESRTVSELPPKSSIFSRTGKKIAVDDSAAPIFDESGKLVGGVVVLRDVRDRREKESQDATSARLASLTRMVSSVGHEINNPLSYITTNLEFVLQKLEEILPNQPRPRLVGTPVEMSELEELKTALADACEGAWRITAIVHGLRTFARSGDEAERHVVSLASVAAAVEAGAPDRVRASAKVVQRVEGDPQVNVNEVELAHALTLLLVHSADSLADHQERSTPMSAAAASASALRPLANEIVVTIFQDDGAAVLELSDNGPGFSGETVDRMFEPFYSRISKRKGTGLELAIAHKIIADLGGFLTVDSIVGMGTRFRVTLPLAASGSVAPKPD